MNGEWWLPFLVRRLPDLWVRWMGRGARDRLSGCRSLNKSLRKLNSSTPMARSKRRVARSGDRSIPMGGSASAVIALRLTILCLQHTATNTSPTVPPVRWHERNRWDKGARANSVDADQPGRRARRKGGSATPVKRSKLAVAMSANDAVNVEQRTRKRLQPSRRPTALSGHGAHGFCRGERRHRPGYRQTEVAVKTIISAKSMPRLAGSSPWRRR